MLRRLKILTAATAAVPRFRKTFWLQCGFFLISWRRKRRKKKKNIYMYCFFYTLFTHNPTKLNNNNKKTKYKIKSPIIMKKKRKSLFLFYIYAKPNANTKKNCNKAISLNHYCTFFFFSWSKSLLENIFYSTNLTEKNPTNEMSIILFGIFAWDLNSLHVTV